MPIIRLFLEEMVVPFPPDKTGVGYIRIHSDHDWEQEQRERIEHQAKGCGVELVRIYMDEPTTERPQRPEFLKMLSDLKKTPVDWVLVDALKPIDSDPYVAAYLMMEIKAKCRGVSVYNTDGRLLSSDEEINKDPVMRVVAAIKEFRSDEMAYRMKRARRDAGVRNGRWPYGTLEGERKVVEYISQLRHEGKSLEQIAGSLDGYGVPTRFGRRWSRHTVYNICRRYNLTKLPKRRLAVFEGERDRRLGVPGPR